MTYVISEPCIEVKDRSCIEELPSTPSTRATACSTSTLTSAWTAAPASLSARWRPSSTRTTCPPQWKEFTVANAAFFTEGEEPLGSPGGAASVGAVLGDAEFVANYQLSET